MLDLQNKRQFRRSKKMLHIKTLKQKTLNVIDIRPIVHCITEKNLRYCILVHDLFIFIVHYIYID